MDSKQLDCLPKGSVVSVLRSKVSSQYDILSRRVLVRHVATDPLTKAETLTEGWASVQSSQGYVILSPLAALCYNNTRWGCTRPVIKQCGHAAHLKCVETHTLSLHQRAAGDQPYDGRFAANINDGEFLCPLCKQLSNILIPRDSASSARLSGDMDIDDGSKSEGNSTRSLRRLLTGARSRSDCLSTMGRRALEDFGSHLYTGMSVPWERATGAQKVKQEKWHADIQKWDFEEGDVVSITSDSVSVKYLLRLLRQQHIAWAAVGHSAAALEAGSRGVESVLPFGVISETFDPWPDYGKNSMTSHPMLLELKRTLTGCSGLHEVLFIEMSNQLSGRDMATSEENIIGSCLADILEGKSWILNASSTENAKFENDVGLWSELTALLAAIPSHVSRDGTIPLRCEARAAAAAMWVVKGVSCDSTTKSEPPAPLAIQQLFSSENLGHAAIPANWGTMDPFVNVELGLPRTPFRLGVACGFLYIPFLAWDMCTFTGALLSCILSSKNSDLPSGDDLLRLAHLLLIGRIVQATITPGGIDTPDEVDLDVEDCWTGDELVSEGPALAKLVAHCRTMVKSMTLELPRGLLGEANELSPPSLLAGVGRAILPFSRALILMLRACTAAIRERQERSSSNAKRTEVDVHLETTLCNREIMTAEDGFHVVKALRCPAPSGLVDGEWFTLINRWLVGAIGLEIHHGSMGRSVIHSVVSLSEGNTGSLAPYALGSGATNRIQSERFFSDDGPDDNMAMDVDEPGGGSVDRIVTLRRGGMESLLLGDIDDSDDELADSMDEAEEMIGFELAVGNQFGSSPTAASLVDAEESFDNSSATQDDDFGPDGRFANVSRSPVLPFQPSLLGMVGIGPGRHNSTFEFSIANGIMSDMSHLGLIHQKESPKFTLIRLPMSFVELYNIVNKVKGRDDAATDETDEMGSSETSICLLTGTVMRSGSARRAFSRAARPPGACTLHARKTASGIGIFFLIQKCTVLLMHNNKSAYSPSLYVDEHGEEDPGLRRGRPLFLNQARYRALELLWRQQGIPREVAQIRSTSDRVIRDNWY